MEASMLVRNLVIITIFGLSTLLAFKGIARESKLQVTAAHEVEATTDKSGFPENKAKGPDKK